MTIEQALQTTQCFYSHFACTGLTHLPPGVSFICSRERERKLAGFGCRYSIYALRKENSLIVAYAPEHEGAMESLRGLEPEDVISGLRRDFTLKEQRLMMLCREPGRNFPRARVLTEEDYPLYEAFFRAVHPGADPEGWLRDYFLEKPGMFTGCLAGGRLVSVCEPPDMPYMQGRIQHTGINTLPEYRRMGFAREAAGLAAMNLLERGVCPQWDCEADNLGSVRTAESVGYEEYGRAYVLEE